MHKEFYIDSKWSIIFAYDWISDPDNTCGCVVKLIVKPIKKTKRVEKGWDYVLVTTEYRMSDADQEKFCEKAKETGKVLYWEITGEYLDEYKDCINE